MKRWRSCWGCRFISIITSNLWTTDLYNTEDFLYPDCAPQQKSKSPKVWGIIRKFRKVAFSEPGNSFSQRWSTFNSISLSCPHPFISLIFLIIFLFKHVSPLRLTDGVFPSGFRPRLSYRGWFNQWPTALHNRQMTGGQRYVITKMSCSVDKWVWGKAKIPLCRIISVQNWIGKFFSTKPVMPHKSLAI